MNTTINVSLNMLVLIFTFSCSLFDEANCTPIVNAKLASKGKFGYHVSIEMYNYSICGGGIIGDRLVITAAHCVIEVDNEFSDHPLKVIVGTEDLNIDECKHKVAVDVEQVFVPIEYDNRKNTKISRTTGDIAVLKLKSNLGIKRHKYLTKLELPSKNKTYERVTAVVTGFGYNDYDEMKNSSTEECGSRDNKLRYTKAKIVNNRKCELLFHKPVSEKHLCAASIQSDPNKPTGVCDGDSGGPLVYKKTQVIGIISRSPARCREDRYPAIYTKIWPFVEFIKKIREGRIDSSIRHTNLI